MWSNLLSSAITRALHWPMLYLSRARSMFHNERGGEADGGEGGKSIEITAYRQSTEDCCEFKP